MSCGFVCACESGPVARRCSATSTVGYTRGGLSTAATAGPPAGTRSTIESAATAHSLEPVGPRSASLMLSPQVAAYAAAMMDLLHLFRVCTQVEKRKRSGCESSRRAQAKCPRQCRDGTSYRVAPGGRDPADCPRERDDRRMERSGAPDD